MNIGLKIKQLRREKNITQEELGELVGLTSKAISRWENDTSYPDITLLPILANIFEISVDELLGVENIKQDEYVKKIKKKANQFAQNNDYESQLKLWQQAEQ